MSGSIKLKHASGNGVIIAAPSSNPAADRTLTLPSDADGIIAKTDASGNLAVTGDLTVDTSTLKVDSSNNRIGIGTTSPDRTIHCHNSSNTTNVRTKFSNGTTGEGASDGFEIGINGSDPAQAVLVNYENSPMAFFTNATERVRVQAGGGISFNGDTAAANALDDYEEGTYTPADASGQSISFSNVHGLYTKVGNLVHVQGSVTFPSTGGQYGFSITLPFTATSSGYNAGGGSIRYTTKSSVFTLHVNANAASFSGYQFGGTIMRNADLSTDRLDFQVTYRES